MRWLRGLAVLTFGAFPLQRPFQDNAHGDSKRKTDSNVTKGNAQCGAYRDAYGYVATASFFERHSICRFESI